MSNRNNHWRAAASSVVAICAFSLGMTSGAAAAELRRFSPDDLPKTVRITDPQVSPDGKSVAIVVARANLKEDRYDTELMLVDVGARLIRPLTHDRLGVASPRWSPTGDRIGFVAEDATKKAQLYVLPLNGGDPIQLTHSTTGVTVFAWRPDGGGLAFAAPDNEPEHKDEAKYEDAFDVGNNGYLERTRGQSVHLWTVDAAGGDPKRLTQGDWSLPRTLAPAGPPSQLAWTTDGRSVIFVRTASPLTGDNDSSRLAVADAATGEVKPLGTAEAPQEHPSLSPDRKRLAYIFPRDGHRGSASAVYVTSAGGEAPAIATADLDHDVDLVGWTPDGASLLVVGADGTHEVLWLQKIGGGAQPLALGDLNPSGQASIGVTGAVAFTATRPDHPAELYFLAKPDARPVQLTHLQTVTDGVAIGRQETIEWKSDGLDVDGVLTYPPGYTPGRKLPLVLYVHGGPTAASLQTFTAPSQILAAQGWLVLEPNYRGSNNGGNAFQTAIHGHASSAPGGDIIAGVEALKSRGIVDERRIAVSGWSYGGQMTAWLLGAYPDTWRAAVAGAPVTDLVDQYTLSDNNVMRAAAYGPSPFVGENLKAYAAESPIGLAWRVKAPTLIMSDVGDWRVTTTQAYKFYHALKDNQTTVSLIAYPVPGHQPADPIRGRDVWRRWVAWLKPYLADPAAPAP
jgi:dipeptidyl aminopeptidase/acylaminoacyl peptidase